MVLAEGAAQIGQKYEWGRGLGEGAETITRVARRAAREKNKDFSLRRDNTTSPWSRGQFDRRLLDLEVLGRQRKQRTVIYIHIYLFFFGGGTFFVCLSDATWRF